MNLLLASIVAPGTLISVLLGVVMFGMGLATRLEDFKVVFCRPKDIAIGCAAQFTIMPALAWALARLFGLDEALTVGVVLVGCCPGGTASNVMTYLAKGDLALSVGMTGVSTLLAPFLTPALTLLLAGKTVDVDAVGMFIGILWVVILPICIGLAAKRFCPRVTERAVRYMPMVSSVTIAVIIALVLAANAERLTKGGFAVLIVVILHNVCGLALGYLIAAALRLAEPKRRALCIEVGMQNSGLAASLAAVHFAAYPMAAVPGAIFSVWHNVSGAVVARLFAKAGSRRFHCRCCGACCRIKDGIVRVSDAEIARIAAYLGMDESSFIANETEVAPDRKGLVLKSRPDGACAYLDENNRCRINPVKPDKCRTFPLEWRNPDSHLVCPEQMANG